MCLIVIARDRHPQFPLILASNRDEYHARPTQAMHWWTDRPVLAGRDLQSGGTWLAIHRNGAMALVTNYRAGSAKAGKLTRGMLPLALLESPIAAQAMEQIHSRRHQYGGFNLLAGRDSNWLYTGSSDSVPCRKLFRGVFGLSNHLLQSDWPKVRRAREYLQASLSENQGRGNADCEALHLSLIDAFADDRPALDAVLPDTGVGLALERLLSPLFIRGESYGTRATTVVTVDRQGIIQVSEQQYGPDGERGHCQRFSWNTTV